MGTPPDRWNGRTYNAACSWLSMAKSNWRRSIQFNLALLLLRLLDHSIRSHQYIRRDRQTDLVRSFQIDDQFELDRLLHRKVRAISAHWRQHWRFVHPAGGACPKRRWPQ